MGARLNKMFKRLSSWQVADTVLVAVASLIAFTFFLLFDVSAADRVWAWLIISISIGIFARMFLIILIAYKEK